MRSTRTHSCRLPRRENVQLSLHADYALRALLYLGAHPGEVVSTAQISHAYGISKHHMVRVLQTLAAHGYVQVTPGRAGGVALSKNAAQIRLGAVVRDAEQNLRLVECFDPKTNACPIHAVCGLKQKLEGALDAFLSELDKYTLADLLTPERSRRIADVLVRIRR